jgi:hypothetical protein
LDLTRIKEHYASRSKEDLDLLIGELNGIRIEALQLLKEEFKTRGDSKRAATVSKFMEKKSAQVKKELSSIQLEKIKRGKRYYLLGLMAILLGVIFSVVSALQNFINPAAMGLIIGGGLTMVLGSRLRNQS